MVYNLDVSDLIEKYEVFGKEIIMVYKKVKKVNEYFNYCFLVKIDENNCVIGIG